MPVSLVGALSAGVRIRLFLFGGRGRGSPLLSYINLQPSALYPCSWRHRPTIGLLPIRVNGDAFSYSVYQLVVGFFSSCSSVSVGILFVRWPDARGAQTGCQAEQVVGRLWPQRLRAGGFYADWRGQGGFAFKATQEPTKIAIRAKFSGPWLSREMSQHP